MKMAVLLSGLNYIDVNDTTIQSVSKSLDSRQYTRNIKKYIYEFFTEKGYTINTFICTNESPIVKDLLESYNPVRHSFIPLLTQRTTQRRAKSLYSVSSIE